MQVLIRLENSIFYGTCVLLKIMNTLSNYQEQEVGTCMYLLCGHTEGSQHVTMGLYYITTSRGSMIWSQWKQLVYTQILNTSGCLQWKGLAHLSVTKYPFPSAAPTTMSLMGCKWWQTVVTINILWHMLVAKDIHQDLKSYVNTNLHKFEVFTCYIDWVDLPH